MGIASHFNLAVAKIIPYPKTCYIFWKFVSVSGMGMDVESIPIHRTILVNLSPRIMTTK